MNVTTRKYFYALLAVVVLLVVFDGTGLNISLAASETRPAVKPQTSQLAYLPNANGTVQLPPTSANPDKVFFPDFGQFVANPLLHFWRMNGRLDSLGGPMSRTEIDKDGHIVQYFQKVALAYYPELANTAWETRPYQIGSLYVNAQTPETKAAFPFAPAPAVANTATRKYFPETSHAVQLGFYDLYNRTGALFTWGFPLSEEYDQVDPIDGKTYRYQLFERGRMRWSAAAGSEVDPNFGTEMAAFNHANVAVDINPDPLPGQAKIPEYNSWAWEHWTDVNLAEQRETLYEGDVPVYTTLIRSGKAGHETPTGDFYILRRVYNEHMKGGSIGAGDFYDLYNVLYTQYFTYEGHALHYAWWWSSFGSPGSHGCVNQDLAASEFAWNWLTIGSRVHVHY